MKSEKEIGGYFEFDIIEKYDNIKNAIPLNYARNCLKYIIQIYKIKEIYIPFYTCPTVWQTLQKENCKIHFYHINKNFMPINDFKKDDFILYTNYFGICAKNIKILSKKYKNLIVDNAQAFFMPRYGLCSFNSLRKFFGVADGALLFCDKKLKQEFEQDTSYQKYSYILKRADINAQFGYDDFCKIEDKIQNEPIKMMSNLTKRIFNSVDIKSIKQKRLKNYKYLEKFLLNTNELKIRLDEDDVPMFYPYLVKNKFLRDELIKNKIYVEHFWEEKPKNNFEGYLQKYLLPLPIDQRYVENDMQKIIDVIMK